MYNRLIKLIASNQKEESISIQRVNETVQGEGNLPFLNLVQL